MGSSTWFYSLFFSWVFFISSTHELQTYQAQLLLQVRKHLDYPSHLDIWGNYNGDLCNLSSTLHMSIICKDNVITELRIKGDKTVKVSEFNGFPIPTQTLSHSFSVDSLVTTLTRLTTLKVLSLVSLGIWGPLPDKIHRLNSLQVLDLSSNFLVGSIPASVSRMVELNSLILDGNYFNGSVPDWFDSLPNLTVLSLKGNHFKGQFPSSISRITTLTDIALCHNQLTGKLPDLSSLTSLHVLDLRENKLDSDLPAMPKELVTVLLSNNSFSAKIPDQFGQLSHLQHLDLSINHLSGKPPSSLFSLPDIRYLNLASNMLSGSLPDDLTCGSNLGFVDISANMFMGELPSCLGSMSNNRAVRFAENCLSIDAQNQQPESVCEEAKQSRGRAVGTIIAVVGGTVLAMVLLAFGVLCCCRRYCSKRTLEQNLFAKAVQDNAATAVSSDVLANARYISQAVKLGTQGAPICRVFSFEELTEATNNFDSSTLMGEGSTGKIYRGTLANGTNVAIRSLTLLKKSSIQNLRVRLDLLSKLHHPNLVSLLGYCIDSSGLDDLSGTKVFLIYDYITNGNYHAHLSETCPEKVLNWPDRLAILIGVAKAVHFLHTGVIPGTLNNRLKTNNILLDEHGIAKLSDYGMAVMTEEIEKIEVKAETAKSRYRTNLEDDVYNFGFILLESLVGPIVTGKGEAFLLHEMASFGSQDGRRRIVDPIVLTTCSQESLSIVVAITSKCISPEPSSRPSFEDVLWNLQYAAQVQTTADSDQKSDSTSLS
ncbi:probable inactive leucine-rich repeat receptor-like protein kinase At3g03770 isoform X2 [Mercurialis annua]|uniref:probable inactive leucine-rich repeat receptor-like protein kinase At3g03770 isoform X2 n=1 Tax=Mercurialis annua TaxID=3986 RepID=UPI00215E9088|nr:probable inactive leucine-rich repeat receptor-like protein kinase At3g03770 isoform X2 [Mercurialis annua]